MKKNIIFAFSVLLISSIFALSGVSYSLSMKYDGSKISFESLDLIEGDSYKNLNPIQNDYILRVFDSSEKVLYEDRFELDLRIFSDLPRSYFDDDGNQIIFDDEIIEVEETYSTISFPYSEDATVAKIYSSDEKLMLTVDLNGGTGASNKSILSNLNISLKTGIGIIILIIAVILGIIFFTQGKAYPKKKSTSKSKKVNKKTSKKKKDSFFTNIFKFKSKPKKKDKKTDTKYCGKCGKTLHKSDRFCKKCGKKA